MHGQNHIKFRDLLSLCLPSTTLPEDLVIRFIHNSN